MAFRTLDFSPSARNRKRNQRLNAKAASTRHARGDASLRRCVAETLETRLLFATFVVTNADNSGPGSLRQAITDANDLFGADSITFNIGVGGPQTISLSTDLPQITDPVILDGTTQPNTGGADDVPLIELDGPGSGDGLHISAGTSTVRGFVINDFTTGIRIDNNGGNIIVGNYIGTDFSGTVDDGNSGDGIILDIGDNLIGGEEDADRNIISGNGGHGIRMRSAGNVVLNNFIGTDVFATGDLGNDDYGIYIDASDATGNLIGGTDPAHANLIFFNQGGIRVAGGSGHSILRNSIAENTDLGIDLGDVGVTNNDPLDADTGDNNLQNFPILSSAQASGADINVEGVLQSLPNTAFRIEFFTGTDDDETEHGEGQFYIGTTDVTTDANGVANININLPFVPAGRHIAATATNTVTGDTSEFGRNVISGTTPGINIKGRGNNIVTGDLDPERADDTEWNPVDLDDGPVNHTFTILNTGSSALTLTGIPRVQIVPDPFVGGAEDFQVVDQPNGVIDPGSQSTFVVAFNPSQPGLRKAQIVIPNTDPDENPYIFAVQGVGSQKSVTVGDVAVTEGNAGTTNANFTVSLSSASANDVFISFVTSDGTAVAGADYISTVGSVTIPAGSTTATITVPVVGDTEFEDDETFNVTIASAGDVVVADGTGVGTIVNDDAAPVLSIGDVAILEGQAGTSVATFTVTMDKPAALPTSVSFFTSDGTATAGQDYEPTSGLLTISPGQTTGTITVVIVGDRVVESNETFFVNLSDPVLSTIGDAQGVATIINDDVTFALIAPSPETGGVIVEQAGGSNATFIVRLSQASTEVISVRFGTQDITATHSSDYIAQSGLLTFAPGETEKSINVFVTADTLVEGDETFRFVLFDPINAGITQSSTEVIIRDSSLPFLAFDRRNPLTYTDANGDTVTINISGPGQGNVQFANSTGTGDAVGLIVDGTTKSSRVTIQATGNGTTLGAVSVNRPLKSMTATNTDAQGDMSYLGSLKNIQFRSATGGGTLMVDLRGNLDARFDRVENYNIDSDSVLRNLNVGEWLNSDANPDVIHAPQVRSVFSGGDFGASISTGTLRKMDVTGALVGADIRPTVGIRQLTAASIRDSNVYVGVNGGVSENPERALPVEPGDFFNDAGFIHRIRTASFSNSRIAAGTLGQVELGQIQSENADRQLGASADRIELIVGVTDRGVIEFRTLREPRIEAEDDFVIRVY